MHPMARKKAAGWMHQYLRPFIKGIKPIKLDLGEYLRIYLEIHTVIGKGDWDVSNKWPWIKWFEDTLTELNKIPDDCVKYVRDSGRILFRPVDKIEQRKLIFFIEKYKESAS